MCNILMCEKIDVEVNNFDVVYFSDTGLQNSAEGFHSKSWETYMEWRLSSFTVESFI